jgi:formylglycine-generating enzyme required for sulfatase activity
MQFRIFFLLLLSPSLLEAENLRVENPIWYFDQDGVYAQVWVSWENSWHHEQNHDAAWIFLKRQTLASPAEHILIAEDGHQVVDAVAGTFEIKTTDDRTGIFVQPSTSYRGPAQLTLKIRLEGEQLKGIRRRDFILKAFGLEMVWIPEGSYFLGGVDRQAIAQGAFFRVGAEGGGYYQIEQEEAEIPVGPTPGHLFYERGEGYSGDQQGTVPAAFPKGVDPFYIMKYELNQGQYTEFLNTLGPEWGPLHASFLERNEYADLRGHIQLEEGAYVCDEPKALAHFLKWADWMAFADWAGLRPLTELEFTKASRGPAPPSPGDYPWGNASKYQVKRFIGKTGVPGFHQGLSEAGLTIENRVQYGASFYWVFDLSGGMWERLITIGHPVGRAFEGTHGDGILSEEGRANNPDWPGISGEGEGFGYRGGGFYWAGKDYHDYNPFSPIAYRPYGSWAGHDGNVAYGGRLGRTDK